MRRFCYSLALILLIGSANFSVVLAQCQDQDTDHVPVTLFGTVYCIGGANPFNVTLNCFKVDGVDCPYYTFSFSASNDRYTLTFYKLIEVTQSLELCFQGTCDGTVRGIVVLYSYPAYESVRQRDISLGGGPIPSPTPTSNWNSIMGIASRYTVADENCFENVRHLLKESGTDGSRILKSYQKHIGEIAAILAANPDLQSETFELVDNYLPALRKLDDSINKEQRIISGSDIDKMLGLIDEFNANASPEFKTSLDELYLIVEKMKNVPLNEVFTRMKENKPDTLKIIPEKVSEK
ncbi:MAG: hypothetical protein A2161_04280 [Candidatus Schekmanbacteria bacterium RBG_13_48_7]|uniref:Uncharacterized protein n=1 Tax=Candidatus Schekmanbacteria bacterium RBG_13_48_7 TaxID=1817878 RepID=A0A1F7RMN5_9BACT|nr:MAG: hypothetical protein A2161_04280 [Candidatus Schekmanbacteria bacterium RBG_13_48_7]